MGIPRQLTRKQLGEIVESYATVFADWKIINGQVFARSHGPIVQHVGFEALRSGAYRPWCGISCLSMPTVSMLYQLLDVKHRQVLLREHPSMRKDVAAAMEQQFRPSIHKPLDLGEIRGLCREEARETTNDLCMLAVLHAYLGETKQSLSYCERMQAVPPPTLAPRLDLEQRRKEFGQQLMRSILTGSERQFLELVAEQS